MVLSAVLGDLLTRNPGTAKLEKFLAKQVNLRLNSMRTDTEIQDSF